MKRKMRSRIRPFPRPWAGRQLFENIGASGAQQLA